MASKSVRFNCVTTSALSLTPMLVSSRFRSLQHLTPFLHARLGFLQELPILLFLQQRQKIHQDGPSVCRQAHRDRIAQSSARRIQINLYASVRTWHLTPTFSPGGETQ